VKIDEDKPKREQLEAENKALTAQLYETKKVQLSITEEVERLRTTRTELVDRRVRPPVNRESRGPIQASFRPP